MQIGSRVSVLATNNASDHVCGPRCPQRTIRCDPGHSPEHTRPRAGGADRVSLPTWRRNHVTPRVERDLRADLEPALRILVIGRSGRGSVATAIVLSRLARPRRRDPLSAAIATGRDGVSAAIPTHRDRVATAITTRRHGVAAAIAA